ncbi:MAG: type II toxin-antitoxin system prevent-host-death family antitoxin [Verrucomicrobiaceae bacterium]|nr:MAG: type II toxin-antitoxin system prevent-host-death family antitoxin [Verrucomicrobiaceae bacterium]
MVTTIGLFEAKTNLGQFAKRASRGEIIEITERGKPLARLVPVSMGDAAHETLKASFERFKELRGKAILNPPGLPPVTVRELIEEGRKW